MEGRAAGLGVVGQRSLRRTVSVDGAIWSPLFFFFQSPEGGKPRSLPIDPCTAPWVKRDPCVGRFRELTKVGLVTLVAVMEDLVAAKGGHVSHQ